MEYIKDRDRLQAWASYSCRERAALIEAEINEHIHPHVLRKLYLRLKITYKPVRIEFTVKNPETLSARRMLFA